MTSAPPAWKRERHGRMEAARSLLRPSPAPSPVRSEGSSETAMWASPSAARVRSRPSNLRSARKQELLVADDTGLRVRAKYDDEDSGSEVTQRAPASEVARLQLGSADSGGAGVTELVRSHSYEALVQLEGILEARHRKIMNDGLLEAGDNGR
uniref:Uncharacterized protein n=1 Tax=Phytophthora ramorum TaxID=164328 RepID=H3HAT5_PHYRM